MTKKGQNTSKEDNLEIIIVFWIEFWGLNLILFPDIVEAYAHMNLYDLTYDPYYGP